MTFARSVAVVAVATGLPAMATGGAAFAQDQTAFDLFQGLAGTVLNGIVAFESAEAIGADGFNLQTVEVTPPDPAAPTIFIDSVSVENLDTASVLAGGAPTRMTVQLAGIDVSVEDVPEMDGFAELGITRLLGDLALDYELDPATQVLSLNELSLDFKGLGTVELAVDAGGLSPEAFLNPQMAALSATLNSLSLTYTDDSLVQRIMTAGAAEEGKTEDEFLQDSLLEIEALQAEAGEASGVLAPLNDFLRDYQSPGPLSVTLSPAAPIPFVSIMALGSPADAISTLGLDVNYGG